MQELLGTTEFKAKNNSTISVNDISRNNDYVLLYFSAAWCGPCKQFTPLLAKFYNQHKTSKKFEVIFISRDKDEASFQAYYNSHPAWPALFDDEKTSELSKTLKVQGVPTLVVVNAKTAEVISVDGRMGVSADPAADSFPWHPNSVQTRILSKSVISKASASVPLSEVVANNDFIMLYFSAAWCGPCKKFSPQLAKFYNKHKKDKKFEIIFMSLDRDEPSFRAYYHSHPWLALAPSPQVEAAAQACGVKGIPSLAVLDAKTGKVITSSGVEGVSEDPDGAAFPWPMSAEKTIGVAEVTRKGGGGEEGASASSSELELVKTADVIANNDYILLYFSAAWCGPCKSFTPRLAKFYKRHHKEKKFEVIFMSLDRDQKSFKAYYSASHPWLAVGPCEAVQKAADRVGVEGIPCLAVVDAKTGEVVCEEGVDGVMGDGDAEEFPWGE